MTLRVKDMAQIALVAALYVVLTLTPPLNALSYGAIQFRLAEMLYFLVFYNRKYLYAVTLGCVLANIPSSLGPIDMVVGGLSTFVFVGLGVWLFKGFTKERIFGGLLNKGFFFFALFFASSMVTIAAELHIILKLPFFMTWVTVALGELLSLLIGAILFEQIGRRIDLTQ
ncbi:QueT transporter family protein [Streptococcus sp. DD12]|uniref:QueT transporter family protein n=1 Tax=Streptococcus sp. DD12 TaxID=1777880 RepID=UPI0007997B24|nr:QueT transporter family protein [Streptococcus sp. DD12]KXT76183.1 Substrate-specific component QueT of putative queuosine-regulated ECF transporter [Streptococcus sp. DD12]